MDSRALMLLVVLTLSGCVTSKMISVTAPGTQPFSAVMVYPLNLDLGSRIAFEDEFCTKLAPTKCLQSLHWVDFHDNVDAALDKIDSSDADGLLMIEVMSDDSSTTYIGSINNQSTTAQGNATAQVYGNTAFVSGSSTSTTSGTSIPMYSFRRAARSTVMLFDDRTGKIAWQGQLDTTAHDAFSGDDETMARASATKLVKEMRTKGLVQ